MDESDELDDTTGNKYKYKETLHDASSFIIQCGAVITLCSIIWYCMQQWLNQNIYERQQSQDFGEN